MSERLRRALGIARPVVGTVRAIEGGVMRIATPTGTRRVPAIRGANPGAIVALSGDLATLQHASVDWPIYRV